MQLSLSILMMSPTIKRSPIDRNCLKKCQMMSMIRLIRAVVTSMLGILQGKMYPKTLQQSDYNAAHVIVRRELQFDHSIHVKFALRRSRHHLSDYRIHCRNCLLGLSTEAERLIHENECMRMRYECYLCHSHTITVTSLKEHMRTHSGEKPFKCEYCKLSYVTKSTFDQHRASKRHVAKKKIAIRLNRSLLRNKTK